MSHTLDAIPAHDREQASGKSCNTGSCCGIPGESSSIIPPDEIRTQVQEFYAERARNKSSCCGDSTESNTIYLADLIADLPKEVTNFTLGCGDPITLAELQPGETVLDLGSGGGLDCFLAARQVGDGGSVIGIDMTPEMLEQARLASDRMGIKNVEFRKGYLEALPLAEDSVDVIISNCVINLSPDKARVFSEMHRVLKPGGRISVSDIVTNGKLPEQIRNDMVAWGACIAGALDMNEFADGLRAAGFVDVEVRAKKEGGATLDGVPSNTLFSAAITAIKPKIQSTPV